MTESIPTNREPRAVLDLILVAALLALAFLFGCFRQKDADIWWHLKTGQLILERGEVPATDWYTFTSADRPWIDLHWLFQVAAAGLFARGGMEWLTLGSATLGAMAVAVQLCARRRGWPWPVTIACWLAVLLLLSGRIYVRPEAITLVCLSLSLAILFHAAERPRLACWLVPVQILWVNVQGLFILGLVLAGLYWLDGLWRHVSRAGPSPLRIRSALFAALVAASLFNPYHIHGLVFPLELFRKMSADAEFYSERISELQSIPQFIEQAGPWHFYLMAHFGLMALTAMSFVLVWSRGRFDLFRLLAFAIFAWLSFQATRNSGQFALVAGSVMAWNVGEWAMSRPAGGFAVPRYLSIATRAALLGVIVAIGFALISGRFYAVAGEGRRFGLGEHPFWHAHDAARFAARPGMPDRLIAFHLGHAAVFEFHKRESQRTFCDPRLEVISRDLLDEYHQIERAIQRDERGWNGRLARHDLRMILTDHRGMFGRGEATLLIDPAWRCVHFDPVAALFLRQDTAESLGLAAIDFVDLYWGAARATTGAESATLPLRADESSHAAEFAQAEALYNVARSLQEKPSGHARLVRTMLLGSLTLARRHASIAPESLDAWRLLGATSLHLAIQNTEHAESAESLGTAWDSWNMFDSARAQFYLRRALAIDPADFGTLSYLYSTAALNKDATEQSRWGTALLRSTRAKPANESFLHHVRRELDGVASRAPATIESPRDTASEWPDTELAAATALRRGDTHAARSLWQAVASRDGQHAIVEERIADTYLVEGTLDKAIEHYRIALELDSSRAKCRWGLARAYLEKGDSAEVAHWCDAIIAAVPAAGTNAFDWMRELVH